MRLFNAVPLASLAALTVSCTAMPALTAVQPGEMDRAQLLEDMRILAADDMQGRAAGTPGSARARAYIIDRFEEIGIAPIGGSFEH